MNLPASTSFHELSTKYWAGFKNGCFIFDFFFGSLKASIFFFHYILEFSKFSAIISMTFLINIVYSVDTAHDWKYWTLAIGADEYGPPHNLKLFLSCDLSNKPKLVQFEPQVMLKKMSSLVKFTQTVGSRIQIWDRTIKFIIYGY
jgi:hypothetical protein